MRVRTLLILGLVACASIPVLAFCAGRASAHDWYPRECCSNQDCAPVADPREVTEDGAWYVYRGVRFRKDQSKPSPDERYHVCLVPPMGFGSQPFIRCMWRPFSGS